MKKKKTLELVIGSLLCLFFVIAISCCGFYYKNKEIITSVTDLAVNDNTEKDYQYLSDLNFITENNWSYNGWGGHAIQKDKNQEGGSLSLIVDGEKRIFTKGLSVHAKGQVTFDISEYSTKFPRFIAKIGVDAARGNNGSIWFRITASRDGSTWDSLIDKSAILTGVSEAIDVDLDVTGYKYLCIYVDPNYKKLLYIRNYY